MSRTIPREIEGADWRVWPEQARRLGWAKLFGIAAGAPLRLNVDIGFGRGEFLTELARQDPGKAVVGVESSSKRVLKLARRLSRTELRNIRLFGVEAGWAVREAFAEDSVECFWVNFPDPWPKRRHERRRLVQPDFVHELSRRLMAGGSLHVATDDRNYAAAIRSALECESLLENAHAPDPHRSERPDTLPTTYQLAWAAEGRSCFFFHYRRPKVIAARRPVEPSRAAS